MEAKHTLGEWVVSHESSDFESTITTTDGVRIAQVKSFDNTIFNDATIQERKANQLLIAAAPELLESLVDLVWLIENHATQEEVYESIELKAKPTIKKAVGE